MRKLFLLILISCCCSTSCTKTSFMNRAVITGFDERMCMCCGGLMINFKNDPQPYPPGGFYQVQNDPASLGIDEHTVFPVYIQVNWVKAPQQCSVSAGLITITSFRKE